MDLVADAAFVLDMLLTICTVVPAHTYPLQDDPVTHPTETAKLYFRCGSSPACACCSQKEKKKKKRFLLTAAHVPSLLSRSLLPLALVAAEPAPALSAGPERCPGAGTVSYTHLRAHETEADL
eukprot:3107779-Rhodomonas_salina.1